MFKIPKDDEKIRIQFQSRETLEINSVSYVDDEGNSTLENMEFLQESDGLCVFGAQTEDTESKLELYFDDRTCAMKIKSAFKRHRPYFGKQKYFANQKGININLAFDAQGPFTAVYQHKAWWLRPQFVQSAAEVENKTQLLLWKKADIYYALVAVVGEDCRADISGAEDGVCISLSLNRGKINESDEIFAVLSAGENPYSCCEYAVKKALEIKGKPSMLRENRTYPNVLERFGWCSWDAFYHSVNQKGIMEKLDELKEKQLPVGWVLIDDGWLDADYEMQTLKGLDADCEKFPNGLGAAVDKMKNEYDIDYVGVWQTIMGYWNGIAPDSAAYERFADVINKMRDARNVLNADYGDVFSFWREWHSYLKNECAIDFVKVDGQSAVSIFYDNEQTYGKASRHVQEALGASAGMYFGNNIINCMGMAPEDVWNRPSSAVSRSSDDFVPEVKNGFREHALQNAYNSLLHGQFYWGDWDMFWSSHEEARQNAILRAVSGGPVYVSDAVGRTDAENIWPLILKSGQVLRCEGTGMPTADCLFESPLVSDRPLKIFNTYKDGYLVAAFNIGEKEQTQKLALKTSDIPQLKNKKWWVYDRVNKKLHRLSDDKPLYDEIKENDARIYYIAPCESTQKARIMGVLDKFLPPAVIQKETRIKNKIIVMLKEGGMLGIACDKKPSKVLVDGEPYEVISLAGSLWALDCADCPAPMVEIEF